MSTILTFVLTGGWTKLVHRAGVRVLARSAERMVKRRFFRDGLRVPVVELALRVNMDATMRAIVLVGSHLSV